MRRNFWKMQVTLVIMKKIKTNDRKEEKYAGIIL